MNKTTPSHPSKATDNFLQNASKHLQFLREYSGLLEDPCPMPEDVGRLLLSAQTLKKRAAACGYPLFSEIVSKLVQALEEAGAAAIETDAAGLIVEFVSEAVAVLESDLLMINANRIELAENWDVFRRRYPFACEQLETAAREASAMLASAKDGEAPAAGARPAEKPFSGSSLQASEELPGDDEIPQEVLEFFIPEAEEHLQVVTECLLSLEANPHATEEIHRLFRAIHTVKGAAAQVGWRRIARVAHRTEDLVVQMRDGLLMPSSEIVNICLESVDVLKKILYRQWPEEGALQQCLQSLLQRIERWAAEGPERASSASLGATAGAADTGLARAGSGESIEAAEPVAEIPSAALTRASQAVTGHTLQVDPPGAIKAPPLSKSVRISLDLLDQMLNVVGEMVTNRTRMRGRLTELEQLANVLNFSRERIWEKVAEFQHKYESGNLMLPNAGPGTKGAVKSGLTNQNVWRRETRALQRLYTPAPSFHEPQPDSSDDFKVLSRSLNEISSDLGEILADVDRVVRSIGSDIDEFSKLTRRMQDGITQSRMVPIGNLYTRLSRAARDAANVSAKQVELTFTGAETELDNSIIQQISDPLMHLVRNAVAHGVEHGEARYHAGKSEVARVALRAYPRGNHVFVEVEDDGGGIDFDRVRNCVVDAGLAGAEEAQKLDERELLEFLFYPGFSTAADKTELAGRGVGLDVVRTNVKALGGEIEVETQRSLGTRFTLKLPVTLIISQALFVRCGGSTFAFPLTFVEEIRRVKADDLEEIEGKLFTRIRETPTEIARLDSLLQLGTIEPVNGYYRLVMVNVSGRHMGVIVDDVVHQDEVVVKSLGEHLRNVKLFPGASIAPDGTLVLLVDLNRLLVGEAVQRRPLMAHVQPNESRLFVPEPPTVPRSEIPGAATDIVLEEKVVVLADDSISVRKFVGRMLEKAGYRVKLASDGMEALEIIRLSTCNLLITDLEMPRTNGFELLALLQEQPHSSHIPVVVVTARAGAKYREHALGQGAAAFLIKPVQEDQLLPLVRELLGNKGRKRKAAATGVRIANSGNEFVTGSSPNPVPSA